jgi:hypothetical protein
MTPLKKMVRNKIQIVKMKRRKGRHLFNQKQTNKNQLAKQTMRWNG